MMLSSQMIPMCDVNLKDKVSIKKGNNYNSQTKLVD